MRSDGGGAPVRASDPPALEAPEAPAVPPAPRGIELRDGRRLRLTKRKDG